MWKIILIAGISSILLCALLILLSYLIVSKIIENIEQTKELDLNNKEDLENEN